MAASTHGCAASTRAGEAGSSTARYGASLVSAGHDAPSGRPLVRDPLVLRASVASGGECHRHPGHRFARLDARRFARWAHESVARTIDGGAIEGAASVTEALGRDVYIDFVADTGDDVEVSRAVAELVAAEYELPAPDGDGTCARPSRRHPSLWRRHGLSRRHCPPRSRRACCGRGTKSSPTATTAKRAPFWGSPATTTGSTDSTASRACSARARVPSRKSAPARPPARSSPSSTSSPGWKPSPWANTSSSAGRCRSWATSPCSGRATSRSRWRPGSTCGASIVSSGKSTSSSGVSSGTGAAPPLPTRFCFACRIRSILYLKPSAIGAEMLQALDLDPAFDPMLSLAGDVHHYERWKTGPSVHLVAGGGGAFLHGARMARGEGCALRTSSFPGLGRRGACFSTCPGGWRPGAPASFRTLPWRRFLRPPSAWACARGRTPWMPFRSAPQRSAPSFAPPSLGSARRPTAR